MKIQVRIASLAAAVALATGAFAQGQPAGDMPQQSPPAAAQPPAPGAPPPAAGDIGAAGAQAQAGTDILNMKAGEIAGREIYNSQGKELGKVDMVGRDRTTGDVSAIVSVGGFLGFGGSKVAIPLDQLTLQDDRLVASTALGKKELRQQSSKYQEKRYETVSEDTTLSQVVPMTAGAGTGGGAVGAAPQAPQAQGQAPAPGTATGVPSFQSLDANADGYITSEEVGENQAIIGRWRSLDRNNDGRLDRAEFSAFEQSGGMRPGSDQMRDREQYRGQGTPGTPPQEEGVQPPAQSQ